MSVITSQSDLDAAVKAVKPGGRIDLGSISGPIRIVGYKGDPKNPLVLTGGSVTLVDPNTAIFQPVISIESSTGITLDNVEAKGIGAKGAQYGYGIKIARSSDITVQKCRLNNIGVGMIFDRSRNLTIADNDLTFIRSDGIDIAGCDNVKVLRNLIRDFSPAGKPDGTGDHPDGIQGWTNGQTVGNTNIILADNCIVSDVDGRMQGIFFGDEVADGVDHGDIMVIGNLICISLWQGITFAPSTTGLLVESNRILNVAGGPDVPGGPVTPWFNLPAGVTLSGGNVAPRYLVGGKDMTPAEVAKTGNTVQGNVTQAVVDKAVADWMSEFRTAAPPPAADPILAALDNIVSQVEVVRKLLASKGKIATRRV